MTDDYILSKQEARVIIPLCAGKLYKEIADEMNISINTVKKHTKSIYVKMHVRNRTEACNKYILTHSASFVTVA
jgi:DNA-binding NarL/FixJ family response regulator